MTSKRRPPQHGYGRWWEPPRETLPWGTYTVIIILLCIILYACSGGAAVIGTGG